MSKVDELRRQYQQTLEAKQKVEQDAEDANKKLAEAKADLVGLLRQLWEQLLKDVGAVAAQVKLGPEFLEALGMSYAQLCKDLGVSMVVPDLGCVNGERAVGFQIVQHQTTMGIEVVRYQLHLGAFWAPDTSAATPGRSADVPGYRPHPSTFQSTESLAEAFDAEIRYLLGILEQPQVRVASGGPKLKR